MLEKYLYKLKLAQKIIFAPAVIVGFLIIFAFCSLICLYISQLSLKDIYGVRFNNFQSMAEITDRAQKVQGDLYKLTTWAFANYDKAKIEKLATDQVTSLKSSRELVLKMLSVPSLNEDERKILQDLEKHILDYAGSATDMMDMAQSDLNAVTMYMATIESKYETIDEDLQSLGKLERNLGKESYDQSRKIFYLVIFLSLLSLLTAIILSYLIAIKVSRLFLAPINATIETIQKVALGDLTQRVSIQTEDEMGLMAMQFNSFVEKLQTQVGKISDCAQMLTLNSDSLKRSSDEIARGAEQVAGQTTAVASAGEEMASTSIEIAHNCKVAAENAQNVLTAAQGSKEVVEKASQVMKEIEENVHLSAGNIERLGTKSDQIGAIIRVIKDIADQTNLLALNAAIEAARAGRHGQGFAVVADEVRSLAERTAQATREITGMIESIQVEIKNTVATMALGVEKVSRGTEDSGKSAIAFNEISAQVQAVVTQVNHMATAATDQTRTTKEISTNIQSITAVTEESAAGAREMNSSALELNQLAEDLKKLVDLYRIRS